MKTEQELRLIALEWAINLKKEKSAEVLELASEFLRFIKSVEPYRMDMIIVEKQGYRFCVEADSATKALDMLIEKYPNHEVFSDCLNGIPHGFTLTGTTPFIRNVSSTSE